MRSGYLVKAVHSLADLVYPRVCVGCNKISDRKARHICWECWSHLSLHAYALCQYCGRDIEGKVTHDFVCSLCRLHKPYFEQTRSAGHYSGVLGKMIQQFKYNAALWLLADLSDILHGCVNSLFNGGAEVDIIIPIPLHPVRQRERSYNQSALLAESLARRMQRTCNTRSLKRARYTTTQTALDAVQRQQNVRGAFKVVHPEFVRQRHILLVDDVMTTGATLNECARVLKKAGAAAVWCITLARG